MIRMSYVARQRVFYILSPRNDSNSRRTDRHVVSSFAAAALALRCCAFAPLEPVYGTREKRSRSDGGFLLMARCKKHVLEYAAFPTFVADARYIFSPMSGEFDRIELRTDRSPRNFNAETKCRVLVALNEHRAREKRQRERLRCYYCSLSNDNDARITCLPCFSRVKSRAICLTFFLTTFSYLSPSLLFSAPRSMKLHHVMTKTSDEGVK